MPYASEENYVSREKQNEVYPERKLDPLRHEYELSWKVERWKNVKNWDIPDKKHIIFS